jgi:hypothetical protein
MGWTLVAAAAVISLAIRPVALPADDLGLR